jgi:hypothetical protein
MSTESPTHAVGIDRVVVYDVNASASTLDPNLTVGATRPARALVGRIGSFMLPIATAAAFAAPDWRRYERTTFAQGSRSESVTVDVKWLLDSWLYSTEPAVAVEVKMLNALLALEIDSGLTLDPTE